MKFHLHLPGVLTPAFCAALIADANARGFEPALYKHKHNGSVASLGLYKGVAQVKGVQIKGFPAWVAHRGYHGLAIPMFERKIRVFSGWLWNLLLGRDNVTLTFGASISGDESTVGGGVGVGW